MEKREKIVTMTKRLINRTELQEFDKKNYRFLQHGQVVEEEKPPAKINFKSIGCLMKSIPFRLVFK